MSTKPAPTNELGAALASVQTAKANKANADRRLKRAEGALVAARGEVEAAAADLRESETALAAVMKKDLGRALKDPEVLMALAGVLAGANGGSDDAAPAKANGESASAASKSGKGQKPAAQDEQESLQPAA